MPAIQEFYAKRRLAALKHIEIGGFRAGTFGRDYIEPSIGSYRLFAGKSPALPAGHQ